MADPAPWPQGYDLAAFDSLPSTNAHALAAGQGNLWVMARVQTAGRGRRARAWDSPAGNLYASLALHPDGPPATIALRSFAAALALRDALLALGAAPADVALKWPNDVLLLGRKLAGILLEASRTPRGTTLVIGFGVNLAHGPDAALLEPAATPPITLAEYGISAAPEAFLPHLAAAYAAWEARFQAQGFAPLRSAWLAAAARLGTQIVARTGSATHEGRFDAIDDAGNLLLTVKEGGAQIAIPAADVYF